MRKKPSIMFFLLIITLKVSAVQDFSLVEKWQPKDEILRRVIFSLVDKDKDIVASFYMIGLRHIKPKDVIAFAPRGQGPGDLMDIKAVFPFHDDMAIVESAGKIKIFKKEGGKYLFKDTIWLKTGKFNHSVDDGLFLDNKWFLSGTELLNEVTQVKGDRNLSYIKVLSADGNFLKNIISKSFPDGYKASQSEYLCYYLTAHKTNLFFIAENELKVHLIPIKDLEVKRVVDLQVPSFYRKMPPDFYILNNSHVDAPDVFVRDWEKWQTEYSRIHKVLVEGDYLVLQMRTCDPKLKKFALLFYNADTFKLEKTVFTNDYLLGARAGRYYFFANGDPGRDEEAEDLIIHIYSFGIKNEKK